MWTRVYRCSSPLQSLKAGSSFLAAQQSATASSKELPQYWPVATCALHSLLNELFFGRLCRYAVSFNCGPYSSTLSFGSLQLLKATVQTFVSGGFKCHRNSCANSTTDLRLAYKISILSNSQVRSTGTYFVLQQLMCFQSVA